MKKVFYLLVVFLSFIFLTNVKAVEKKYLEVPMYDMDNAYQTNMKSAYEQALTLLVQNGIIISNNNSLYYNDKVLFVSDYDQANNTTNSYIPEDVTFSDNITYDFTPDDTLFIAQVFGNDSPLLDYDGVKLIFVKECPKDTICVSGVTIVDSTNGIYYEKLPEVKGLAVDFNVSLNSVKDFVKYRIIINNNTDEDYKLNVNNFKDSKYFKYEYSFEDGSNIVDSNTNKTLFVTIKYEKEVPVTLATQGYEEDNVLVLTTKDTIENPKTGQKDIVILLMAIAIIFSITYALLNKKENRFSLSAFTVILLIPFITNALSEVIITVNTKVSVAKDNVIEARYPNGRPSGENIQERDFWVYSELIEYVYIYNRIIEPQGYTYKYDVSENKDNTVMAYLFKLTESEYQLVIMANGKIYANEDSSYMFWNIGLNNSDGFQYLDTSRVKNMEGMFGHKTELEGNLTTGYQVTFSLDLRSFDTSNVTNMAVMFYNRKNLKQILVGPLWNTDNVVNSRQMFYRNEILTGERGTNYDSSHSDKEYARLDKEGSPGYFSSRYIQEY